MRYTGKNSRLIMIPLAGKWFYGILAVIFASTAACALEKEDINWLIEVLAVSEGSVVAEIGAGDGSLTLAMADQVGSAGKIYSSELGADSVRYLRNVVNESSASNITVVKGHPERTNFPDKCCDALFMRRVYHHFEDPSAMNKSIWEALKPGGRLAIIDFRPRGGESIAPDGRAAGGHHGVTSETLVRELTQAGFTLVSSDQRSDREVYVVMRKPDG